MNESSNDPLKFAISVKTEAEYMRLPPAGQADPIFGLKRSYLNLLILPCRENGFRPPVKSFVLRRKRAKKGVRLIDITSLREYIRKQVESGAPAADTSEPQL